MAHVVDGAAAAPGARRRDAERPRRGRGADALAADGIAVEVIDVRTIRPLDVDTIVESVARTNRLLVVDESPRSGGWSAEVLASVTERALDDLDDAWRIAAPDRPIPYSPPLEDDYFPSATSIAASVRARFGVTTAR